MHNQKDYTSWNKRHGLHNQEEQTACSIIRRITQFEVVVVVYCWMSKLKVANWLGFILVYELDQLSTLQYSRNIRVNPEIPFLLFSARLEAFWRSYGQFSEFHMRRSLQTWNRLRKLCNQEDYTFENRLNKRCDQEDDTSCIVIRRITHLETIAVDCKRKTLVWAHNSRDSNSVIFSSNGSLLKE